MRISLSMNIRGVECAVPSALPLMEIPAKGSRLRTAESTPTVHGPNALQKELEAFDEAACRRKRNTALRGGWILTLGSGNRLPPTLPPRRAAFLFVVPWVQGPNARRKWSGVTHRLVAKNHRQPARESHGIRAGTRRCGSRCISARRIRLLDGRRAGRPGSVFPVPRRGPGRG